MRSSVSPLELILSSRLLDQGKDVANSASAHPTVNSVRHLSMDAIDL